MGPVTGIALPSSVLLDLWRPDNFQLKEYYEIFRNFAELDNLRQVGEEELLYTYFSNVR
jgi:hypothetical protein